MKLTKCVALEGHPILEVGQVFYINKEQSQDQNIQKSCFFILEETGELSNISMFNYIYIRHFQEIEDQPEFEF